MTRDDGRGGEDGAVVPSPGVGVLEAFDRGRRAWPQVDLSFASFASFARALGGGKRGARPALELHEDVYLACACLEPAPGAREALEAAIMVDVPKAARRATTDPDVVAEVTADLRLALLDGERAGGPLLGRYQGLGPLRSFVMVLAMRRAFDRARRKKEIATEPSLITELGTDDPSLARVAGNELREPFLAVLREKLSSLPTRDRTILRLHVVDGVSAEAIGRMYGVHRSTATRWIVRAKQSVFEETREVLEQRFAISTVTFSSFTRDEALGLDASLATFLRGDELDA